MNYPEATSLSWPLAMSQVSKRYDGRTVIRSLDLSIREGEILALLGPNGAGKSTTIAMALGFVRPDAGTVTVAGHNVTNAHAKARAAVSYIPESVQLYPLLTGYENLQYFAALAELQPSDSEIRSALTAAGIDREAHCRRVGAYSKGMRQKVGIAIATMRRCKLLLLDEPTSGLDPKATDDFYLRLRELANRGMGILLTTHDIPGAKECADRVALMRAGDVIAEYGGDVLARSNLDAIYRDMVRSNA